MKYKDTEEGVYRVSDGLSAGRMWFTSKRAIGDQHFHRIIDSALPLRDTRAEAQADLNAWARKRKLQEVAA
jgi:hypothetical protein